MRIDNECIRDILFTVEENSFYRDPCCITDECRDYPNLQKYENDQLSYHLRYLEMKGLLFVPYSHFVNCYDLTPDGHEFLANIRDDNNWKKIKSISSNIGFASLKIISSIAEGVATAAINYNLGFSK
ncbi:DUF2513 domain-containing protein [Parablautia intestinalis]|nr:DUF2513 domain-containing protein [Parablautia intestinalis]